MLWKRFIAIGILVIIIVIAALYVYLNTYDYNKLKPQVARMVEDATGRKLGLDGEISLEIGLAPTLVVTNAGLANVSWGSQPQMIEIEKLEVKFRLLPLLFKEVDIKYMRLAGVSVLLETGPQAQANWDFPAQNSSDGSIVAIKPTAIELDRISVENLQLEIRGPKTKSPTQFNIAKLALNRQAGEDALALVLKAELNGQPLTLSGKTGWIRDVYAHQPFALQLSGSLANAALKVKGTIIDALVLQGIDVTAQLTGKNAATLGPVLALKLPPTDEFEIHGHLTGSAAALTMKNIQGSVRRGGLRLAVNGAVKDLHTFAGIDLQSQLSGSDLAEFGEILGEKLPRTDDFEIHGRLTGSTEGLTLRKARGIAHLGSIHLSLTGTIKDLLTLNGLDLQSRLTGKELAEIGPLLGAKLPGLGPFDLSGRLSGSAKALALNKFSAMVDKSDFSGLVKAEFLKRPQITIRLESSVINFTALMKSLEQDAQKAADKTPPGPRLFSDDPLPFDVLKKVGADIELKAENIHAKDAHLRFGHVALKIKHDDFRIDKFETTYKQAKISGRLHIRHGSPTRVATNFLVQNFDLGALLKETGVNDHVQATVDIATHLNSRGDSVHSLMANLDGSIGAVMGEGYLTKYLDLISMDLSQKVTPFWGHHNSADQVKCAVVEFDIKNGVAASKAFVFDSRAGILRGKGHIDLGTEKIDFLLVPTPRDPGLLELSTKLRVGGTILDADVGPDKLAILEKGALGLSSLAVGPLGLLAPFVHLGASQKHPCEIQSIGKLGLQSPVSK